MVLLVLLFSYVERISLDLSILNPPYNSKHCTPLKGRGPYGPKKTQEFALHTVGRISSLFAVMTAS